MGELTVQTAGFIVLRCLIVYILLLILLRIAGKREVGQMTPFDLVVLLLISNSVQNAMTGPDTSLGGGIVAAVTLIGISLFFSRVSLRSEKLRRMIDGTPTVLVCHGQVYHQNLRREGMSYSELLAALREHECENLERVELAMLEIDGEVSVIRADPDRGHIHHTRKRLRHHAKKP